MALTSASVWANDMFQLIKEIFSLLTSAQKKQFYLLQVLVIIMAIMEITAISSIAPFMSIISNMSVIHEGGIATQLYQFMGIKDDYDFVFALGLSILVFLVISASFSILTFKLLANFGAKLGVELSSRLYKYYLNQNWLFHSNDSSARLTKQVSVEAIRLANSVIQPLLQMSARVVLALLISIGIFMYDPTVALMGITIFLGFYLIIYRLVRSRLKHNGQVISDVTTQRFRLMNEGYGGIKDIILLGARRGFVDQFEDSGKPFAKATSENMILGFLPRYIMELIAFGSMILLILVMVKTNQEGLSGIIPIIALYALAAFKLLPALQQSYHYLTIIKGNISAFYSVRDDLLDSFKFIESEHDSKEIFNPKSSITLDQITFTYPNKQTPALNQLSMNIHANQSIGIVGSSGSGKSTCIDVLLGLIQPEKGRLLIDGKEIDSDNLRAWQNSIGFVPQSIFLSEGSIAENIAFGVMPEQIDYERVKQVTEMTHLATLIDGLEHGLATKVGERGVQLSGGQRQRIGIARALYHQSSVLVFDEATSALDGITENGIMDAIREFQGQKTIIMIAHRLKTIQHCDQIFILENGTLVDSGTFDELLESNEHFAELAKFA